MRTGGAAVALAVVMAIGLAFGGGWYLGGASVSKEAHLGRLVFALASRGNQPIHKSRQEPARQAGAKPPLHSTANDSRRVRRCINAAAWRARGPTNCPRESAFWPLLANADKTPNKVIANIGCNKGMDAAILMALWDRSQPPLSPLNWLSAVMQERLGQGACRQTSGPGELNWLTKYLETRSPLVPAPTVSSPKVYCVEALVGNYKDLTMVAQRAGWDKPHGGHSPTAFVILNYAVTAVPFPATVPLPHGGQGQEAQGIGVGNSLLNDAVKTNSVDLILENETSVDVLLIDTEGHDPYVLMGSVQSLLNKNVHYCAFEYHGVGFWRSMPLEFIIAFMDAAEFDCYWTHNSAQLSLITRCWIPEFEFHGWSNIACVRRGHVWWDVMAQLSGAFPA